MADDDDLDALLDNFVSGSAGGSSSGKRSVPIPVAAASLSLDEESVGSPMSAGGGSGFGSLLADLADVGLADSGSQSAVIPDSVLEDGESDGSEEDSSEDGGRGRCDRKHACLGGSTDRRGRCTGHPQRACNRLHCSSCDWKVEEFVDCRWGEGADYLFLRNNFPEREKLDPQLEKEKGTTAYACQCSQISVTRMTKLSTKPKLSWACRGH